MTLGKQKHSLSISREPTRVGLITCAAIGFAATLGLAAYWGGWLPFL